MFTRHNCRLYTVGKLEGAGYNINVLRNSTPREWRRQNSPVRKRKGDSKINKRNFNVVGNNETENQELAKGIAFAKSRRAEINVVQMVEHMRDQALPNGVIINDVYYDRSMTREYEGLYRRSTGRENADCICCTDYQELHVYKA